jgi:hypothetical protein
VLTLSALVNAEKQDPETIPHCYEVGNASVPESACGIAHPDTAYIKVFKLKSLKA